MKGNTMVKLWAGLLGLVTVSVWSVTARGQAWISFVEDPTRISGGTDPTGLSVINDFPCDPNCTGGCNSVTPCAGVCACACEKDMAVDDLDKSLPPLDDLVIVRKQPFELTGGVSNLLFMNENGTMVDRTADLAPCFNDPTQDRDVVIVDVNRDPDSTNNFPDIVTAATFGEQPRVYINLGKDAAGNWRGLCLCYDKETDTCHDQAYLTTHAVCFQDETANCFVDIPALSDDRRISPFTPAPKFCGVAAGDVNNDGCDDLYFVDYDNTLEDRLLFNTKEGNVCTGFFTDVTETPSTRLCPNGPPCFNESGFGTGARIIDMDKDGNNDIVKTDANPDENPNTTDGTVLVLYNDAANVGHFDVKQNLSAEFPGNGGHYMFAAGDMNRDGGVDLYVVRAPTVVKDVFLINQCIETLQPCCEGQAPSSFCFGCPDGCATSYLFCPTGQ